MLRAARFLLAISLAILLVGSVEAECRHDPDPLKNCEDAVSDWWNENSSHQSQSAEDVQHRTEGLKDTLRECTDCAMDTVQSGANNASPTANTDADTDTDTR